jgi:thiamine transporter ThiT
MTAYDRLMVDPSPGQTTLAIEERSEMDLRLPGIILTVTGILAIIITLTRGPNLGMSRRTGLIAGIVLLVLGVPLLTYAVAVPQ